MIPTHTNTPASNVTPFGRFMVIAVFAVSLITTGCDVMDASNEQARLRESSSTSMQAVNQDEFWVGPPSIVPLWHDLVGTWQYIEAGVSSNKTITFTNDQRIRVETLCTTHEGPFFSERKGQLTIALTLVDQTCGPLAEESLIRMLEAATAYKIEEGQLFITTTQSEQQLGFNAVDR